MQTQLTEKIKNTKVGQTADAILRRCVHCGFCTATCPTYQLLGDELDGPRGRIYLIKQLLEGQQVTRKTQTHLDRCLTCRSCETTCPSGVEYSHLLDIGRNIVAEKVGRRWYEVILRRLLLFIIPNRHIFSSLVKLAYPLRTILPKATQNMFKGVEPGLSNWPTATHSEKVILIDACAQDELAPRINHATANVLDKLAIEVIRLPFSCCGALAHHLSAEQKSIQTIKHNIDLWWTQIESGISAIVSTASGCGVMIKDYGHIMKDDPEYADKAKSISEHCKDIVEIISDRDLSALQTDTNKLSVHTPCTLQHGQKLNGVIDKVLQQAGFKLCETKNTHLCCGSAGTYSILQKNLSQRLLQNKLAALTENKPDIIVTANIGCLLHLQSKSEVPVKHWIELLDN